MGKRQDRVKKQRASISFPPEHYSLLEKIAEQRKVSIAWVVRDAVEKYVTTELQEISSFEEEAASSD